MEAYIDLSETLFVILGAIITTSVAEFASWYLVYRTDEYQNLKNRLEGGVIKYNKQKDQFVKYSIILTFPLLIFREANQKNHDKKVSTIESSLKAMNQEMTMMKMKSNLGIGLLTIITLNSIGNHFQGIVVAKLPFEPFSLLQNITHRGVNGSDYTDCSYIFMYIMSAFIWRANVQRIFGRLSVFSFEGPKLPFQPGFGQQPSFFGR